MDGFFNSDADGPGAAHAHSQQPAPAPGGESQGATGASAYGARALSKSRCEAGKSSLLTLTQGTHRQVPQREIDPTDTPSGITVPEPPDASFTPSTVHQSGTVTGPIAVVQDCDDRYCSPLAAMQTAQGVGGVILPSGTPQGSSPASARSAIGRSNDLYHVQACPCDRSSSLAHRPTGCGD